MKRKKNGEAVEVSNLLNGQLGALGLIVLSKTLIDVEQNAVAKLPHFQGAFLTIGVAGENCKVSLTPHMRIALIFEDFIACNSDTITGCTCLLKLMFEQGYLVILKSFHVLFCFGDNNSLQLSVMIDLLFFFYRMLLTSLVSSPESTLQS